ncbi:hypothetical protein LINGRAHAP2_LOCUS28973, partial [Linum grandiflorum]
SGRLLRWDLFNRFSHLSLHSAVSSTRLTSYLEAYTSSSKSLSQDMFCSANPGV